MMGEQERQPKRARTTESLKVVHSFHLLANGIATCACGRWAMTKVPMTTGRAQQLAKRYGKDRLGPQADLILKVGVSFRALTQEEALKGWEHHIKNLPEKGERIHGCSYIRQKRQEGQVIAV